jgi:hypothetical protein
MHKSLFAVLILLLISLAAKNSAAQRGFTIEAGLIYDHPSGLHNKPYPAMKSGLGYTGILGYDFIDRAGLDLGVMKTSHNYELSVIHGAVTEDNADKTTIFLKAHGIPFRHDKFDLVIAAGIGYFDISGQKMILGNPSDIDFSGVGLVTDLKFRYNISDGLALSFYIGANFVNYNRYEIFGYKADYGGKLPGGNSLNWGFTVFHRIGIPQI